MANVVGLGVLPVEVDWSGVDKSIKKQGSGFSSKLGTLGKAAGLALGAGIAGAAVGLFKVGSTFDAAFDTIRVGTGATGDALKALQGDFREVVKDIPTDFATASQAIADLNTRTGQTGEGLQELAKRTIEMTRLTGGDLSSNIASTTRLFGDWGIAAGDQADTLDKLFRASQATGIGIDQLSGSMVKFGAPLRQLGFGFEQSVGLLAKFEKEGVNAELVMGSLRIALGKMARDGEPAQETLQRTVEAIKNAGSASEANALALELFGARAGPDMAAAIREGRFELGDLLDTIESGEETILGAAADTNDFAESWQMFKNRVLLVLEPIAARVFNAMGTAMEKLMSWWDTNGPAIVGWVKDVSSSVREFVDENLPKVQAFVRDALEVLSEWWTTNGPTITDIATGMSDLLGTLFDAAVKSVQWFIREWDKIKPVLEAVGTFIALTLIPHFVALGLAAIKSALQNAAAWAMQSTAAVRHGLTIVGQIVIQVGRWVWLSAQAMIHAGRIAAAWLISMGPIGLVGLAVAGLVVLVVKNFDTIKNAIGTAWDWVASTTSKVWDKITDRAREGVNAVIGVINGITGAVNSVLDFLGMGKIGKIELLVKPGANNGLRSGGSGAFAMHTGGIAGRDQIPHDGVLRSDEVLRVLQKGEEVLTSKDPRHIGNLGIPDTDWVLPVGGPFDFVGNGLKAAGGFIGDQVDKLRGLIASTARPLVDAALSGVDSLTSPFGRFGAMGAGMVRKVAEDALAWLSGADKEAGDQTGIGSAPIGTGYKALIRMMASAGVPHAVTSTFRPGGRSLHSTGRAADFSIGGHGNKGYGHPGLRRIFDALLPYAGNLAELILAGAPFNIKNGKQVGGYAWGKPGAPGNHWNHVHAATMHDGGVVTPDGVRGLRGDEILAKLQVGETVIPKGGAMGGQSIVINAPEPTAEAIMRAFERRTWMDGAAA